MRNPTGQQRTTPTPMRGDQGRAMAGRGLIRMEERRADDHVAYDVGLHERERRTESGWRDLLGRVPLHPRIYTGRRADRHRIPAFTLPGHSRVFVSAGA